MNTTIKPPKTTSPGTGKLIAVASGKGGVGKTWFSITLAHALSRHGKKVLLFDGDIGLANVDVQLGLMAGRDLGDVIEGNLSIENTIQKYEDGGFDVIAGRSGQGSLALLPLQQLNKIVQKLRGLTEKYDIVIIDLGAGVDRTVRFVASAADINLVVMTDEPTSLTDAYAFIKLSHGAGHADNIRIVVNAADSLKDGEKTYSTITKACKNFLKINPPLAGIIHHDKRVKDAIRAQTPYMIRFPNTDTAQDVEKIATGIVEKITV